MQAQCQQHGGGCATQRRAQADSIATALFTQFASPVACHIAQYVFCASQSHELVATQPRAGGVCPSTAAVQAIQHGLQRLKQGRAINLDLRDATRLVQQLQACRHLEFLSLNGSALPGNVAIFEPEQLQHLVHLDLSKCRSMSASNLASVRYLRALHTLEISSCDVAAGANDTGDAKPVSTLLRTLQHLQTLNLSRARLPTADIKDLRGKAAQLMAKLVALIWQDEAREHDAVSHDILAAVVASQLPQLQVLDLSGEQSAYDEPQRTTLPCFVGAPVQGDKRGPE